MIGFSFITDDDGTIAVVLVGVITDVATETADAITLWTWELGEVPGVIDVDNGLEEAKCEALAVTITELAWVASEDVVAFTDVGTAAAVLDAWVSNVNIEVDGTKEATDTSDDADLLITEGTEAMAELVE